MTGQEQATQSSPTEPTDAINLDIDDTGDDKPYILDQSVREVPEAESASADENENDMNTHTDAGNNIYGAFPIYPGEPKDKAPGRGTEGQMDPSGDSADWYYLSVQAGMTIDASISNFEMELIDATGETTLASGTSFSATAETTGNYFIRAYTPDGASAGSYELDVSVTGQNDAGTGGDAGNSMSSAASISPGSYEGYLDSDDWSDWYSFDASSGQGIKIELAVEGLKSDFDVHLYNPDGEMVYEAMYYGDDTLEYPADMSGTWTMEIDIWPGWDEEKWPDDYFLYGSGPYAFELQVGGSVSEPPEPIPQRQVNPIAQTFIVNNDPGSNRDEFAYAAAVPAANYLDGGDRYVSPIVYQGDDTKTWYYGTVDDTTQYLLDDWNAYLGRHGMTAEEYTVPSDPVTAAAQIAKDKWESADTAVVVPDGSNGEMDDTVETVVDTSVSISTTPDSMRLSPDDSRFKNVDGKSAVPMFLGKNVGGIYMEATGDRFQYDTGIITPRYENVQEDWWPHPYDGSGPDSDTFYPVIMPGFYAPYVTGTGGMDQLTISKYPGERFDIPIDSTSSSINVTITTDSPSTMMVYLIDPEGVLRRPNLPHWVGEPEPIHHWNGGHWEHNFDEFRKWRPEPATTRSVEIHNPSEGKWHAVVVQHPTGQASGSVNVQVTAEVRTHNPDRCNAQLSAANGAVIASLNHAPLLYVNPDSVPSETQDALDTLGVSNIIFVNIGEASGADVGADTTYTTMQEVVDAIKGYSASENVITVTSTAAKEGFFAPSAMIAAYHGSPVFDIGMEAPQAVNYLEKARVSTFEMGDYYHGSLAAGHLHKMSKPFDLVEALKGLLQNQALPPIGFDQHKRWFNGAQESIHGNITAEYGLDLEGKEAYIFVADREQVIRDPVVMIMSGNESFAGHFMLRNAAMDAAQISRSILYPAIIYANPGRNVTSSILMNFPDGRSWTTNDGTSTSVRSSQRVKQSFSSHGRFYEGHCIWDNMLERYNEGVSISYYSGHGTGGSGISFQWKNISQQFPYVELRHEELHDFEWWDGWRGYMYDDTRMKTPRWGGFTWYNAVEPNLYDIVHFKYVDQYFENLHSEIDLWMSCTTASHPGPNIYLEHGAVLCYGNGGTGLCPQADLLDDNMMESMMIEGKSIGEAFSNEVWLHQRDFTSDDPTAMYGSSSLTVTNIQMIFGDPTLVPYSPEWTEPTPIAP
ncbi:MAG: PPC domain-containing protein [Thermoplasmatota archaeon]